MNMKMPDQVINHIFNILRTISHSSELMSEMNTILDDELEPLI